MGKDEWRSPNAIVAGGGLSVLESRTGSKLLPDSLETGRLPLQNCRLVGGPHGEDRLIGAAGPGGLAS